MRIVTLIPDLVKGLPMRLHDFYKRFGILCETPAIRRVLGHQAMRTPHAWGGTLNMIRHAWIARQLGAESVMATPSGKNTYGKTWGLFEMPYIRWESRRPDDICIIPDTMTELVDECPGPCIVYLQVPIQLRADFDYMRDNVQLWTDSPHMLELAQEVFPNKEIPIVPNVIDDELFRFVPQEEREDGLVFAFPRKGPEFIAETRRHYREKGGRFWHFELIDGLPLPVLAREFQRPQAFLASGVIEGCALPPQESMASGIVVVGRNARGANFSMEHRKTAMIANDAEHAAQCLLDLEDLALRKSIAENAHEFISRYFTKNEPTAFWKKNLEHFSAHAA